MPPRRIWLTSLAFLVAALAPAGAHAATIKVTTKADHLDGPKCSLRDAVESANTNTKSGDCPKGSGADTIEIPGGYYKLDIEGTDEDANADGDLDITAPVTIKGAGATKTTVDGGGGDTGERAFHIDGDRTTISDLTVRHSDGSDSGQGGAIFADYGEGGLTVNRARVIGNHGYYGGGVSSYGTGKLTITNSTIADNDGDDGYGGGVYSYDNDVVIKNTKIQSSVGDDGGGGAYLESVDNVTLKSVRLNGNLTDGGGYGGGAYINGTRVRIQRSTASANGTIYSASYGGGLYLDGGDVEIKDSTISGNSVAGSGGGIYHYGEELEISGSSIIGNIASDDGGGVYQYTGDAKVRNTSISGNGAYDYTGGYITEGTSADFNNVTIYHNQSYGQAAGVGLYEYAGTVTFSNSIIARNRYEGGSDYYDCYAGTSAGNNLVSDAIGCGTTGDDIAGDSSDRIDPRLGPLQKNGGPTMTHAVEAGSPALGEGGPGCETKDQRGESRANKCDLGAFER